MTEQQKSRICKDCAGVGKLKWLPCQNHGLVIPAELCWHEHNSPTLIHNGEGITCHDCGTTVAVETVIKA